MPENEQTESTQEGVEIAAEQAAGEAQTEQQGVDEKESAEVESAADETAEDEGQDDSGLPDWAQRERKALRDEAARYRTALRSVEAQLEEARKAGQDVAAMQSTIGELQATLAREKALRLHPIPEALQQFVTATTEEEAIAQAKALAENVTAPARRPTDVAGGGLNPIPETGTRISPREYASQRFKRR